LPEKEGNNIITSNSKIEVMKGKYITTMVRLAALSHQKGKKK
jgi:hypothetical protein